MTISGICELVLETDDVARLQGFYEDLGLKRLLTEDEDRVWLRAGECCRLGIWSPGEKPATGSRSGTSSRTATAPRTA